MLIKKSEPMPRSAKTPMGGRKMARMILRISLQMDISLCQVSSYSVAQARSETCDSHWCNKACVTMVVV